MMKSIFGKVMWVGKTTTFLVGLAVIAGLTAGLASDALAANGNNFILGKLTNTATAITRLAGNVAGPSMQIFNTNTASNARGLDILVDQGNAPMTVNASAGKAFNLDADKLDGKDSTEYVRSRETYSKWEQTTGSCFGGSKCLWEVYCDSGDVLLSGGYNGVDPGTTVTTSLPEGYHHGWYLEWANDSSADNLYVYAYCGDLGTPHT